MADIDLVELIRMVVEEKTRYMQEDIEKLEKKLQALARATGKVIPWEASFVVEDVKKDE